MPFQFSNVARMEFIDGKMDNFNILSLDVQYELLKRRSSPTESDSEKSQASSVASAELSRPVGDEIND